ncbi:MAG: hypothetical protein ACTSWD_02500 [Candidatus Heimdallarchaeota archaeon]
MKDIYDKIQWNSNRIKRYLDIINNDLEEYFTSGNLSDVRHMKTTIATIESTIALLKHNINEL